MPRRVRHGTKAAVSKCQFGRIGCRHDLGCFQIAVCGEVFLTMMFSARLFALGPTLAGAFASLAIAMDAQVHRYWFAQRARQRTLIFGIGADTQVAPLVKDGNRLQAQGIVLEQGQAVIAMVLQKDNGLRSLTTYQL
jgi:hypothetical protein